MMFLAYIAESVNTISGCLISTSSCPDAATCGVFVEDQAVKQERDQTNPQGATGTD